MKSILRCLASGWLITTSVACFAQDPLQSPKPTDPFENEFRANSAKLTSASFESNRIVKQANDDLKRRDVQGARALYMKAISAYAWNGQARLRLAEIDLRLRNPDAAIADLKPIVEPPPNRDPSDGREPTTRMLYVLALLDAFRWEDAVACYEDSVKPGLRWRIPGGEPVHTFASVHFSVTNPDIPGMRAQAHLILGAMQPAYIDQQDAPAYMLPHIREVLRIFPGSLDARFLEAVLLAKMDRFDEARAAFARAEKNAPKAALDEIKAERGKMERREELQAAYKAKPPAKPDKPRTGD
jgi:tetratricopeptide (TPR) repeat protein